MSAITRYEPPHHGLVNVMNAAHLGTGLPNEAPGGEENASVTGHVPLTEDLRRSSIPTDQFGSWRVCALSFVFFVVLPVLTAAGYYGLIAADKYAAEFRFMVRSAEELSTGDGDRAPIAASKTWAHEAGRLPYMAADYLKSRNIVRELDRGGWLGSIFSRDQAGWLSGFDKTKSEDDLWLFWQDMTSVSVDRVSGLVLVRVLAFTADDAVALAQAASRCTEKMIDGVDMRERGDMLLSAEKELRRASLRYSDALAGLRDVRNQEKTVDPQQTIRNSADTLLAVTREKLSLQRERDANLEVLSADAPTQRLLSRQIEALESQINSLTELITSQRKSDPTLAQAIARFEEQELEIRFSKRLLEIAQAAYERGRQETERQHVYFALFVEPKKPEIAEYPRRARAVAFTGICAFALWGVAMLVYAAIRDHKFER